MNESVQTDELRALLGRYEDALNGADVEGAVALYSPDGMIMPQGLPTVAGAGLPGFYRRTFEMRRYDVHFTVEEVVLLSDTAAYAITSSVGTLTSTADRSQSPGANREVFIFGREDRDWRIARYMFNNDAKPLPE